MLCRTENKIMVRKQLTKNIIDLHTEICALARVLSAKVLTTTESWSLVLFSNDVKKVT